MSNNKKQSSTMKFINNHFLSSSFWDHSSSPSMTLIVKVHASLGCPVCHFSIAQLQRIKQLVL